MKPCHDIQTLMHEVLAGTAAEGERLMLEEHLATCDTCRREWELLAMITATPGASPDPGPAFWDGYHDRLLERMADEVATATVAAPIFRITSRRMMQVAAAIVLVTAGILIGRSSVSPAPADPFSTDAQTDLVALDAQAWSVLDRSRTLLLAVANFDASQDTPSDLNLDRRQAAASDLVRETADLRTRMSETDRQRMTDLLSDLEVILLQLAHLDAQVDIPQIEMMQQGLDRKAILFKIDIESLTRSDADAPTESQSRADERSAPRRSAI